MKNIFSIWRGAKQDDPGFEELVAPHIEQLYRLGYRFSGTSHDAEDLVQELLTRLYPKAKELSGIEKLGPWLSKSLYHLFIDQNRRTTRSPVALMDDMGMDIETAICINAGPDISLARQQTYARMEKALFALNSEQRSLVAMHDMEGYTLPELATMLDKPLGTLKSGLHRARVRLREQLSDIQE